MIDYNRHIEIENYLQGNLTPEEKSSFEAKMALDQHLREEVELQQLANSVIVSGAKLDIKNQLQNIHSDYKKGETSKKNFKIVAIIAAILLGVTFVTTLLSTSKDEENKKNNSSVNPISSRSQNDDNIVTPINDEIKLDDVQNHTPELLDVKFNSKNNTTSPRRTPFDRDSVIRIDWNSLTGMDSVDTNFTSSFSPTDNEDSIRTRIDSSNSVPNGIRNPNDRCKEIENLEPKYSLTQPCFGKTKAAITFEDDRFESFTLNTENESFSNYDKVNVPTGKVFITGIGEYNCKTLPLKVNVKYDDCTYTIQPNNMQFLEFSFSDEEVPVIFTLRSARSGFEVYKQIIDYAGDFTYQGLANDGTPLPMANYVYVVSKHSGEFITKGQVTIVR